LTNKGILCLRYELKQYQAYVILVTSNWGLSLQPLRFESRKNTPWI